MRSNPTRRSRVHALLLTNIAVGVAIFATAVYFIVTGEYANLTERQATESLLNKLALGGMLYSVVCWYADQFFLVGWNKQSAEA